MRKWRMRKWPVYISLAMWEKRRFRPHASRPRIMVVNITIVPKFPSLQKRMVKTFFNGTLTLQR